MAKQVQLSDPAKQVVLTASNIVYDPKGVEMIKQALGNIKDKNEKAIPATVAMVATTLLHKMGDKVDSIPDEEMWGKMGVVHTVLGSIFEIAKHLGYNAPHSALEPAYKIVEDQMNQPQQPDQQQAAPQGTPPAPMQGAMPQPSGPPQPAQAPMMGGMPQ